MSGDKRKELPKGYILQIEEESAGKSKIIISNLIGRGGSCLVYKGSKLLQRNGETVEQQVIVKEFYPVDLLIERLPDGTLQVACDSIEIFESKAKIFFGGQSNHIKAYERSSEAVLPSMFCFGKANGTVYAVSLPGAGKTLSQISFESLNLNMIASIMEGISSAIETIHKYNCLYLDCKPDNFFYLGSKYDIQQRIYLFDFDTVVSLRDIKRGSYKFCSASEGWVPPEQELFVDNATGMQGYKDSQHMGFHTDIYSVGAIFFWLLTGRKPITQDLEKIQSDSFPWEKESRYCAGEREEILDRIQSMMKDLLLPGAEDRQRIFPNAYSICKVTKEFQNLQGYTIGNSQHFEPIWWQIKTSAEEIENEIQTQSNDLKKEIQNSSVKNFLFGTKKRKITTITVFLLIALCFGVLATVGSKLTDKLISSVAIDQSIDEHLLLSLSNANHQYEVGLENWRRLDYVRAEEDILAAREEISKSVSQDSTDVAVVNNSLGCLYIDMGRYEEAYDYLNNALVAFKNTFGEDANETLAVRFAIAQYDYYTGDIETAQKTLQEILDAIGTEENKPVTSSVLHFRALIFDDMGDYESAISTYESALSLYDEIISDGELTAELADYANDSKLSQNEKDEYTAAIEWIALTYNNMGKTYIHAEEYEKAQDAIQKGLNLCLDNIFIGTKNLVTAKLYMNQAILFENQNEIEQGIDAIDLAMRIQRNIFDFEDVYPGLVETYDIYADLLYKNEEEEDAQSYYDSAISLAISSYTDNHPVTAESYYARGKHFLATGNYAQAQEDLSHAIEIRKNILGYKNVSTVKYLYHLAVVQSKENMEDEADQTADETMQLCQMLNIDGELAENIENFYHERMEQSR